MTSSTQKSIILMWMILLSNSSIAQSWLPEFRANIGTGKIASRSELHEFLSYLNLFEVSDCNARMSMFYFRVNYLGRVDSLYSEGNLKAREIAAINENILKTSGHWILPTATKETDQCWFVFPCFLLGPSGNTSGEDEKNVHQLTILRNTLSQFAFQRDAKGRYLLPPNIHYDRTIR